MLHTEIYTVSLIENHGDIYKKEIEMAYLLERLKELSTYQGIIVMLTALGVHLSPELGAAIASCGVAVFGLVSVIVKEKK